MPKLKIHQKQLKRLHALRTQKQAIQAEERQLREELIALWQNGAVVEPGSFILKISRNDNYALYKPRVIEALGEEMYEWLREQVAPTTMTCVRVVAAGKAARHGSTFKRKHAPGWQYKKNSNPREHVAVATFPPPCTNRKGANE